MYKKDERMIEVDWSNLKNSVVTRLNKTFQGCPYCFFTEHDIHSVFYNIAKEELQLNNVATARTSDRHRVLLVHHEYPTPFRCSMKGYDFQIKYEKPYRRGHYDLVILNPEFVGKSKLKVVYGKDYRIFEPVMREVEVEPLIWACEVVFFPGVKRVPKNALKTIEQDALKVKETLRYKVGKDIDFCKMGSVLVFTSHTAKEASDLKRQVAELSRKLKLEVTLTTAR